MVNFIKDSSQLVAKYVVENIKANLGEQHDNTLLKELEEQVEKKGLKEEADLLLQKELEEF